MDPKIKQIQKIVLEMIEQRGYTNIEKEDSRILATKGDGHKICFFVNIIPKFNIEAVKEYNGILQRMKIKHGVLIYEGTPTASANSSITELNQIKMTIEVFHANDLLINITKSRYVPKMYGLSDEESKEFKEKYGTQISKIKHNPGMVFKDGIRLGDPIVRFYNWKKGQIIRVYNTDETISYSIVS